MMIGLQGFITFVLLSNLSNSLLFDPLEATGQLSTSKKEPISYKCFLFAFALWKAIGAGCVHRFQDLWYSSRSIWVINALPFTLWIDSMRICQSLVSFSQQPDLVQKGESYMLGESNMATHDFTFCFLLGESFQRDLQIHPD